jgi:hypothetical protein
VQRPIRPEWLLRQANELAGRDAEQGQPRNADLRRAVSAAYYGLYHFIVLCAVDQMLPECSMEYRYELARHFQHNSLRVVCSWIQGSTPPERAVKAVEAIKCSADLCDVADSFIQLQKARHDADYNHQAPFTRANALASIDQAQDACTKLWNNLGTPEANLFFIYLGVKSQISSG